jgi:hypothetical protein
MSGSEKKNMSVSSDLKKARTKIHSAHKRGAITKAKKTQLLRTLQRTTRTGAKVTAARLTKRAKSAEKKVKKVIKKLEKKLASKKKKSASPAKRKPSAFSGRNYQAPSSLGQRVFGSSSDSEYKRIKK